MRFFDRDDAGHRLAQKLQYYRDGTTVVLALPRGGVVVGAVVAMELGAPLGLILVRKIGHPASPEYAIGAVAEDNIAIYNEAELLGIDETWLEHAEAAARQLIKQRRDYYYRGDFSRPKVTGKTAIIVDDGIATGLTMEAAVQAAEQMQAQQVIVAVPVGPTDSVTRLETIVDSVIVLDDSQNFQGAVGEHYQNFEEVTDEAVRSLLQKVGDHATPTNR